MDQTEYVAQHRSALLDAAKMAYTQYGRGAMVVYPQQDESGAITEINWHLLAELQEDEDPAVRLVAKYNPEVEAIVLVVLDDPQEIHTYRLTTDFATELMV